MSFNNCKFNERTRDEFNQRKAELAAKEQDMNDWYEKGELPPVGEVVEFCFNDLSFADEIEENWNTGDLLEVLAHRIGENGEPVAVVWNKRDCYAACLISQAMRPQRTEMDKLVNQAMSLFSKSEATTDAKAGIAHAVTVLIEEGYRKTKPMSEQEFIKQCVDICGHGDTRLYRAGCRFVEQVKV